jgi:hypothetical protein
VTWIKRVLLALLFSLIFGLAIGTLIRLRLERATVYMGSAAPGFPFDVGDAGAPVLDPREDEEQVG